MPIREYICRDCAHIFEEILKGYDDTQVCCPQCESSKTERLVSAFGGYTGSTGGGSTRPRGAGSFRGKVKRD